MLLNFKFTHYNKDYVQEVIMNYKGEKCFACNEIFNENDDVVVCPECGTPYHRECYKEQGQCINHQLHETGEGWKRTITESPKTENLSENSETSEQHYKTCPRCLTKNNPNSDSCINCGATLTPDADETDEDELNSKMSDYFIGFDVSKPCFGFDPNEDFEGAKMSEIFSFVKTNTLYYIPIFKKMKSLGSKISFNLISFFFPYFYFANRKMWIMSLVSVLVTFILGIPSALIGFSDTVAYGLLDETTLAYAKSFFDGMLSFIDNNYKLLESLSYVCSIGNYIFKIAMCLFANWLYYRFTIKSVNKIKLKYRDENRCRSVINASGGTSLLNIFLIALIMFAGYMVFCSIFSFLSMLI